MSEKEFMLWLQREKLLDTVKTHYPAFKSILKESLKLGDEKLLMIGDFGLPEKRVSPLLLGCYMLAAKDLNARYEIMVEDPFNKSGQISEGLMTLEDQNSIVAAMSNKIRDVADLGKSFRTFIKEHKHRFLSTPGLGQLDTGNFQHLVNAISVDYHEMYERGQRLKHKIDAAKEIFIHTASGTELYVNVKGMPGINNSGIYEEKGIGGNIPAGEVYCAPNTTHAEGTVVIDGSIRTIDSTILLKEPITLKFEKGRLVSLEGKYSELIQASLTWAEQNSKFPHGVRRFAELGIGTNPKASIVGPTVINEKALGTAHVAIGSNAWFGGTIYSVVHLDQVFKNPQIEIDGQQIEY